MDKRMRRQPIRRVDEAITVLINELREQEYIKVTYERRPLYDGIDGLSVSIKWQDRSRES